MTSIKNPEGKLESQEKEELLGLLFQHASSRPKAPAEDEAATRAATYSQWQKVTGKRKQKRYLATFGVAASLVLAVIAMTILRQPIQSAGNLEQLANLEIQLGDIFIHNIPDSNSSAHRLAVDELYAGQVITTNTGARVALGWKTGESIRMDENSKLALISVSEIELVTGRVYVDTKKAARTDSSFVIRTFAGAIKHTGTQYLAGIEDETVTLAVREGEVILGSPSADIVVHKGELVSIGATGKTDLGRVPTYGKMWEWTNLVTPELELDGMSAFEFVEWAGRETGREVEFIDPGTRELSMQTQLRGSVKLSPDKALELILLTSDIEAETVDEKILIRRRPAD